jgi:hypothetical protein
MHPTVNRQLYPQANVRTQSNVSRAAAPTARGPISRARRFIMPVALGSLIGLTLALLARHSSQLEHWATELALSSSSKLMVLNPYLWGTVAVGITLSIAGAARGNRIALVLCMLLGVPLDVPFRRLGDEAKALRRKAHWLARFLLERPRSHNTAGAHLACGAIAVKKTLKALALRGEHGDRALVALVERRARLTSERNRASRGVYQSLIKGRPDAIEHSQRAHACNQSIAEIDAELLTRRLEVQARIVQGFLRAWDDEHRAGRVSGSLHASARIEFEQPAGEPPALLPNGLVHGPLVFWFEYGMFFGRLCLSLAFVATFQVSFLLWALVLFGLDLYVVEPVVLELQMSSMGLFLDGPGHKLVDLKRYIDTELPEGALFRLPITVPKFSSNPAWNNLSAIIKSALTRSEARTRELKPFAMREGRKEVVIELEDASAPGSAERTAVLTSALRAELERGRAKFPLRTEVLAERGQVVIRLLDDDQKVWDLIGEDASQAFIYLWRNLRALADTLSYLGRKFQPVFVFASNTEDPDAIEYEQSELAKLQAWSDREYAGQVGFLYLLRGGEWYDYNAGLERFDARDKNFSRAAAGFKQMLRDPATPARERLLALLIDGLPTEQLAAAFNLVLADERFYEQFDGFSFDALRPVFRPTADTLALLERRRAGEQLSRRELLRLNRELLLTALPMRMRGAFFKKVGNDLAVEELLVTGKTRPSSYIDRRQQEHVQDPLHPNYARVWGDFATYTGLAGDNAQIQAAILRGDELRVESVPEISAIVDDKNEFAPGEVEKALASMLHPENRHVVIGVPRIQVTYPELKGKTVASEFIIAARAARETHNAKEGLTRVGVFSLSTPAYGKWFKRPKPYHAHYVCEALNAAHALSHDFQQSYLVAGAGGRLSGFTEALYGPKRFDVRVAPEPATPVAVSWRWGQGGER